MGMVILKQLEGDSPKTVYLAEHAAPFGRPRKGAVMTEETRVRQDTVRYAGDSPPTRHIFGSTLEPIEMHGRWRDRLGGPGFAKAKAREIQAFFDDKRQVQLTWDDNVDVEGLIVRFTKKRESPGEIEWELETEVDRDLLASVKPVFPKIRAPQDITNQIIEALKLKDKVAKQPPALRGSVVDLLNQLVGDVNSASALLVDTAADIDSFATGTVTALRRFRAGLAQTRVAVQSLRGTYDNLTVAVALENETADQSQPFWDLQAGWAASSLEALRLLAAADRQAAISEQGNILVIHDAALGDTWESIASQYYGSAHRAEEIRDANGVPAGQYPIPGTPYVVPR